MTSRTADPRTRHSNGHVGTERRHNPFAGIGAGRAVWPILFGLGVVAWMFVRDFEPGMFRGIRFTWASAAWLAVAVLCMFGRDLGYMIRIRVLSEGRLSWRQAFRIIMLWEFTSAVTPSAVGGTSVAVVYVHKEGISVGESTAIVMLTSFLDELYFLVMFPVMLLAVGGRQLFEITTASDGIATGLMTFALVGYGLKALWVAIMGYGLFFNPRGLKWVIVKIFGLRWLRRWRDGAIRAGDDIVACSARIRHNGPGFWTKALGSTFLSWSSRYLVANALVMAMFSVGDHLLLFARQLVMWIMMLVMPTPGGSGFAEYIFSTYCSDLIMVAPAMRHGAAVLIALLWRGVTYYPYLAVGAVVFPRWVNRNFMRPGGKRR